MSHYHLFEERPEVGVEHGQGGTVIGRRADHLFHLRHHLTGRRQIMRV